MRLVVAGLTALCVWLTGTVIAAQTRPSTATKKTWTTPRTPWGDPDLEGMWPSTDMVGVPFERPAELAGRTEVSDKEFAEREAQARRRAAADSEEVVSTAARTGDGTGPPSHWLEWGKPSRQASLVVRRRTGCPLDSNTYSVPSRGHNTEVARARVAAQDVVVAGRQLRALERRLRDVVDLIPGRVRLDPVVLAVEAQERRLVRARAGRAAGLRARVAAVVAAAPAP